MTLEPAGSPMRTLGVILINSPIRGGARTLNKVASASRLIGCNRYFVGNLFSVPTPGVLDINLQGAEWDAWEDARNGLDEVIGKADELLVAWGLTSLRGMACVNFRRQVNWVLDRVNAVGLPDPWMVGSEPRHPSRWHQYVSDKYARTPGGDFDQRLDEVLVTRSVEELRKRYQVHP